MSGLRNNGLGQRLGAETTPLLRLTGLQFTYSPGTPFERRALAGIDLEIQQGEVVVLAGATGSGKSTLLQVLAGLLRVQKEQLFYKGAPVEDASSDHSLRRTVGLAFQFPENQLFAETVASDVSFAPRNMGIQEPELTQLVEAGLWEVGLDPKAFGARNPLTLSGGEQRRVALAGVLAGRPQLLLLDEPCAGLDGEGRDAVIRILSDLRQKGETTVILVTHDIERYVDLADRFVLIHEGVVGFDGCLQELPDAVGMILEAGVKVPFFIALENACKTLGSNFQSEWRTYAELAAHYIGLATASSKRDA